MVLEKEITDNNQQSPSTTTNYKQQQQQQHQHNRTIRASTIHPFPGVLSVFIGESDPYLVSLAVGFSQLFVQEVLGRPSVRTVIVVIIIIKMKNNYYKNKK